MARILDQLIGHRDTLRPLLEANSAGRLASTLLFTGVSGIGKRLAAHALAQALVCENAEQAKNSLETACGHCGPCLRIASGQSESLRTVQPEGVGIKIDQARDIMQFLSLQKVGRSRIVIIDQAHLLNPQAGNSLLKSLEEPPAGTHFILVTSLAAAVLSTIRSRSQLVRFKPLSDAEVRQVLGEEADDWIVRTSHGSIEAARKLQENREDYQALEDAALNYLSHAPRSLPVEQINQLRELTKDKTAQVFVAGVVQGVLRDALRAQAGVEAADVRRSAEIVATASAFHPRALQTLADLSIEFEHDFMRNVDRGLIFENFAIQWRAASQTG